MSDVTKTETTLFIRDVKDCMYLICRQCPFSAEKQCTVRHAQECTGGWIMACSLALATKLNRMMKNLVMPSLAILEDRLEREKE
jgi:hypothetical protein